MLLSKLSNKRYALAFLGLMGFVFTVSYIDSSRSVSTVTTKFRQAFYNPGEHQKFGETTVVAHAPGFTLFENAYWKNHTWYFVSSRPWAFPELSMVMTNAPGYDEWPPLFHDGLARVVSHAEAEDLGLNIEDVQVVKGSTFVFNDKTFLDHFYHLVGEMFLGAWRVYTSVLVNPFDRKSQKIVHANTKSVMNQVPSIDRFIFNHAPSEKVFDHAQLNHYFLQKVFPQAPLEFAEDWQERAASLRLHRFDLVMIADRWSGHMGNSPKPMERAFRLPVPSNWVSDLKKRLLANYKGPVSLKDPSHAHSKPVITYLSRQEAVFRTLSDEAHEELSRALKALEEEGLAEVNIETFTDKDPKDEQVAKLSRTTILVGLHGNGLTNLIWMTPDAYDRSAVYEIQQAGMFTDDYAIISEALGLDHWIIGGRDKKLEYCQRGTCGIRGNDDGVDGGIKNYTLRVPELVNRLRHRLSK